MGTSNVSQVIVMHQVISTKIGKFRIGISKKHFSSLIHWHKGKI